MRSYAVIGCGAIGGYYGARLQKAGHEVHFLLRSDYAHVRRRGLMVESKDGDFRLPKVNACCRPENLPACDYVLIALKATHNHVLADILPRLKWLRRGTAVLMQNGLNQEETVARLVGPDRVMSGLCFVCSNKVGPGHIRHLDYGLVTLADYRPNRRKAGITRRMRLLAADLEAAGIPAKMSGDLWSARWQKLVWNIPFSGLATLLLADTKQLINYPPAEKLARQIMREVIRGAVACAASMPAGFEEKMIRNTRVMIPYVPSMLIDRRAKRPMEVEAMFGEPCRAARAAGVKLPRIETLYEQLSFINDRVCRKKDR